MVSDAAHNGLRFMKMHGLGNDFVVIDARRDEVVVDADLRRSTVHEHLGGARTPGLTDVLTGNAELDAVVFGAPDIDRFCSSSIWTLPFREAFTPEAPIRAWRGEQGFVLLAETRTEGGAVVLHALESMWCQACPIPARDPRAHGREPQHPPHLEQHLTRGGTGIQQTPQSGAEFRAHLAPPHSAHRHADSRG